MIKTEKTPLLFMYGQRVWNHLLNEYGHICGFLGGSLNRYRVVHSKVCYSIPEEHLDPAINKQRGRFKAPLGKV